jgi:hypothetical protein
MVTSNSGKLNEQIVRDIVFVIHSIVKEREGLQENAGREIEYAFHAALFMVEAATCHQPNKQRVESLRAAAAMFADIAETDYIGRI